MIKNESKLKDLGFEITLHDKMPDVVLYREDKDWIYFIEAVDSVGPMDPERIKAISKMTEKVNQERFLLQHFWISASLKSFLNN